MIFSLSLGFLMGKDIHCLPCTNFFIKCSVCIISFDSYHKPMRSWDCPHFSRGPWPPSNFPLWPVRPVLLGFCTAGSERKGEGEKGGVWGSSLVDSIGECGKDGATAICPGRSRREGEDLRSSTVIYESSSNCLRNVRIELGLLWNYI